MRDDPERLRDMLEAIERIERHTGAGRTAFEADELVQTWVLYHLQIMGEAARALSVQFQREHDEIPWSQIIGMRHVLVHQYFGIDLDLVWRVVERDLAPLKASLQQLLGEQPAEPG